jgi:hypothetical protein
MPLAGRRRTPSRKLSGLQTREGGDAGKEVAKDIQDHNRNGVLFQPHNSRHVLCGGAPRQDRGTAEASDPSKISGGRSRHKGTKGSHGLTPTQIAEHRSVTSGSKCKQFVSGQNFESSSNGSTADYDRV